MSDSIPTGDTIEVVLDRLMRAGNFASNGVYLARTGDAAATAETYIGAAQAMLDEARRALEAVKADTIREVGESR